MGTIDTRSLRRSTCRRDVVAHRVHEDEQRRRRGLRHQPRWQLVFVLLGVDGGAGPAGLPPGAEPFPAALAALAELNDSDAFNDNNIITVNLSQNK